MNFSSSWDAWPDTWTAAVPLVQDLGTGPVQGVDDASRRSTRCRGSRAPR